MLRIFVFSVLLLLSGVTQTVAQDVDPVVPQIPHLAVGGPWRTTIVLVNQSSLEAPFRLRFRDSLGRPLLLQLQKVVGSAVGPSLLVVELADTIPMFGLVTYQTVDAPNSPVTSGYAELVEGTGIGGQAIFRQVQPNGRVYAAASPLELPKSEFILPVDNTSGALTALALANGNRTSNVLDIAVRRDSGGEPMEEPTKRFEPWEHRADTVESMISPTTRNKYSTVDVNARNAPLGTLGLRFQDSSGPFSSFATVEKDPWPTTMQARPSIAQLVAGGPWTTTLLLVNLHALPESFRLEFRQGTGEPMPIEWEKLTPSTTLNVGAANELSGTIPGGGVAVFRTLTGPAGNTVRQGFARLASGNRVRGQAIFSQEVPGGVKYEAASSLRAGASWMQVPFDLIGSETGLALANSLSIPITLNVRVVDETGEFLGTMRIGLQSGEHKAGTVANLLPQLAEAMRGKRGVIEISSGFEFHALGLRFEGDFFTSFPVIYPAR